MSGVEVMSSPERRRRWSEDQKRAIVAEAFSPGASVSAVARRADVVPGQIYRWRRELSGAVAGFAEVVVSPSPCERLEADAAAVEIALGTGSHSGDDAHGPGVCDREGCGGAMIALPTGRPDMDRSRPYGHKARDAGAGASGPGDACT
jgi:transposase